MDASSCCSSAPEVKEVKESLKPVDTNPKTVSSKSNTNKITINLIKSL